MDGECEESGGDKRDNDKISGPGNLGAEICVKDLIWKKREGDKFLPRTHKSTGKETQRAKLKKKKSSSTKLTR